MNLKMFLILLLKLFYFNEIEAKLADEVQDLTENFFANLNADPYLIDSDFNEKSMQFINHQTENYVSLMIKKYGINNRVLAKRSIQYNMDSTQNYEGTFLLHEFSPLDIPIAENASDIFFIHQTSNIYAMVLKKNPSSKIILYKHDGENFNKVFEELVPEVNKLIQYVTPREIFVIMWDSKHVFIHTIAESTLKLMQTLDLELVSDVIVWESTNGLFLAIAREMENSSYTSSCLIYIWLGKYFDLIDHEITTYGAKSISTYSIGALNFLAIANYQHDDGRTSIYSEIFKYNIDTEIFESHQRILTHGAVNVQFFSFKSNELEETYLAVANSVKDENHVQSTVNSIIYKYVDKHFIPFQSIPQRVDKWITATDSSDHFLLISLSKSEGIRVFTYDGWRFVEAVFKRNKYFQAGITYVDIQRYANSTMLKLLNYNYDNNIHLYKPNFSYERSVASFEDNLLEWCKQTITDTSAFNVKNLKNTRFETETVSIRNMEDEQTRLPRQTQVQNESDYDDDTYFDRIQQLHTKLEKQLIEVNKIANNIGNYLSKTGVVRFEGEIHARNVVFKKEAFFENDVNVEAINDRNSKTILDDVIHIHQNLDYGDIFMNFNIVRLEHELIPKVINSKRIEDLLHTNDSVDFHDVTITGKAILDHVLKVGGFINSMRLNSNTALLVNSDQIVDKNVTMWKNIKINNARSNFLNNMKLGDISAESTDVVNNLDNLKVKNLVVRGLINGKDIATLNKHALKIFATEQSLDDCVFEELQVETLLIKDCLSHKEINDGVLIHKGEYNLSDKDAWFSGNLSAKKIKVKSTLNQLEVDENGDFTFLLRNASREQYVSGLKIFEKVTVINPLNLQVKINSERLKEFNPIRIIPDEELIVKHDYNFTNNVVIESKFISRDMRSVDLDKSLLSIIFNGLEINNSYLPHYFRFEQPLNVKEINISSINGIKPKDLVVNRNETVQKIPGNKIIESNLHITGSIVVLNVNNVHIPDFENNILKISGDQEIAGKFTIQDFSSYSIDADRTRLGTHMWQDIVTSYENQRIYGTTVITNESTKVNSINANFTVIQGFLNAYNLSEILKDTVNFNTSYIEGHKVFDNLQVENIVTDGINLDKIKEKLQDLHKMFKIKLKQIALTDFVSVEKLNVDGYLNEMETVAFIKNWNDEALERIFNGSHNFDNVTVYEKIMILSNEINGYNFNDIVENTVKANDSFRFDDATFKEAVNSLKPITLLGNIPGLDLENVITSAREEQTLSNVSFNNNIDVIGNLTFIGLVNGMNYTDLCSFSHPYDAEPQKSLIITENTFFLNGPSVEQFQNINLDNLYDDVWLTNREMHIEGHIEFDTINFENDVIVLGLVDGVNLTWLTNNYFSKTKNQIISAHLDFTDGIHLLNGLSAFEMQLKGLVSGLNLTEFLRTAILNDVEQVFDYTIDAESCTIQNVYGDFLINNLNLPNDVMRYDVVNIITATKEVPVVITEKLSLKEKVHVQNVDVLDWVHSAVSKYGSIVRGKCIFSTKTYFSEGLGYCICTWDNVPLLYAYINRVVNKVNGLTFDNKNIMIKNEKQIVSGRKVIHSNFIQQFKDITLERTLNGTDIIKLFKNQANKNLTNLITTEVSLDGPITTNNINVEKLYNNINVTNLISDMWISQDLHNYFEKYGQLLNVANKIKESFSQRAFYLDHYKQIQYFDNVFDAFYFVYQGEAHLAMINALQNKIELYRWNELKQGFENRLEPVSLEKLHKVAYLSILNTAKEEQYAYFEHISAQNSGEIIGTFTPLNDINTVIKNLATNGTRFIHSTLLPDISQKCFIFTYINDRHIDIYCESGSEEWISIHQQLETYTILEVVTFTIGPITYIVTIEDKNEDLQNCIILWKFDINTRLFNKHQTLYITAPNSVSVAVHNNIQYLAISSSNLQDAQYKGIVEVYRFNTSTENLVHWESLLVENPKQLQFVILPSNEFILYVLTDNCIKPLQIFIYGGVGGFKQKDFFGTTLSSVYKMKQFSIRNNEHFILAWNRNGVILLHAFFRI